MTTAKNEAQEWLAKHTQVVPFGTAAPRHAMSAMALWEWLGKPYTTFRQWWNEAKKRQKLKEGEDFVFRPKNHTEIKERGKGRNPNDYLLTPHAALRVAASEATDRGRATLRALADLVDKIEAGDPALVEYINRRHAEVHGVPARRPWSMRIEPNFERHWAYINQHMPGCFSMLSATIGHLLILEDILLKHEIPLLSTDLPDGSIGKRWANYRAKVKGWQPSPRTAPLYLPDQRKTVHPMVYPGDERSAFDIWLVQEYLPTHSKEYLTTKFAKKCGDMPPLSAADNVCRRITGRRANLTFGELAAIDSAPDRMIRAGTALLN